MEKRELIIRCEKCEEVLEFVSCELEMEVVVLQYKCKKCDILFEVVEENEY